MVDKQTSHDAGGDSEGSQFRWLKLFDK